MHWYVFAQQLMCQTASNQMMRWGEGVKFDDGNMTIKVIAA